MEYTEYIVYGPMLNVEGLNEAVINGDDIMKKRKAIIVIIYFIVLVVAGIIYSYITRPIKIGVILPIQSPLGNEENLFVRYYRDMHPKIGQRPVEFIIENKAVLEKEIKAAFEEMNNKGVSVIIGGVTSEEGKWLSEESAKYSLPTFGITASSAQLSNKKDAFFRFVATNDVQAGTVANYYNRLGKKKLVLVTSIENESYVDPFAKVIKEKFQGEVLSVPFYANEETYNKILNNKPDSVFCILQAKDVIDVIKNLKAKNPEIKIGSSSWGSSEILSLYSSPLLDGVLLFSNNSNIIGEEFKTEITDFESKYNIEATKGSHYTLAVLHTIYQGLEANGDSRQSLKNYFETPRVYETAYGKVHVNEYGDSLFNNFIVMATREGKVSKKEILK